MTTINKPVHEIRLGSVRAAIWANITQNGVRHSVTISRSYRVGNDWKKLIHMEKKTYSFSKK